MHNITFLHNILILSYTFLLFIFVINSVQSLYWWASLFRTFLN